MILWLILRPEHQPPRNASHAAQPYQRRATECSLPLASNIVRLIRHCGWDVRVCSRRDEEDAKITSGIVGREAHDGETDEREDGVEDEDGAADAISIADPGGGEHDNGGEAVGRGDEALGGAEREVHAFAENDGEEVGDGVGHCGYGAGWGSFSKSRTRNKGVTKARGVRTRILERTPRF